MNREIRKLFVSWVMMAGCTVVCAQNQNQSQNPQPLTLLEAHETALQKHPLISVADLKALAAKQVTRQAQSAFFPNLSANVMSVGAANPSDTRLAAIGGLNNPLILDRNAEGLNITQLITDFGRTANLAGSAKLRAQAEADNARATREQILLAVDGAFYGALRAQAVTRVAQQTVATRQLFLDQVTAMATNKLRSDLDVSFARVDLEDARLIMIKSQNDLQAAFAQLSNLLGERDAKSYQLAEEPLPPAVSTNISLFVEEALRSRPDLVSLQNSRDAALKFARAEKALAYPTLSAIGSAGVVPVGDSSLGQNYAAAGVSVNLPLFTGGMISARRQQAELEARAAEESLRDLEDNIIRDVRITWLSAQNAYDRYHITADLVENARQAFTLADARYKSGISSIVEFDQAQLNLIAAQINYATTEYEYLLQRSALSFQTGTLH
jgi:outer membrane protein